VTVAEFKAAVDNPTEENRQRLIEYLRPKPKDERPLSVRLAEANERMSRGEFLYFEEVKEYMDKLERLGLFSRD